MTAAANPAELEELFAKYANTSDLDGLVSLYEAGALLTRADRQVRGIDAIRAEFTANLRQNTTTRRVHPVSVRVQSTDGLALVRTVWRVEVTDPTGRVAEREWVTCEVSRQQDDGTWKYIIDDPGVMADSR